MNRARDWRSKHYIPTRHLDVHPTGPAARHYTRGEAEEAVRLAKGILEFAEERA